MKLTDKQFRKYHALGNSYIVVRKPEGTPEQLSALAGHLCSLWTGIGADGVLYGPYEIESADFGFDVYNPDGSRAEISGNGARIFCRYLYDEQFVKRDVEFTLSTGDRVVTATIIEDGQSVAVDMGLPEFRRQGNSILSETLELADGTPIEFYRVSVGNPHCVILQDRLDKDFVREAGSQIEVHSQFPEKTNVQFVKVINKHTAQVEIWERGAGYTLSSGSSSTAVAAVLLELGHCQSPLRIEMPGGVLDLCRSKVGGIVISGPAVPIAEGTLLDVPL